MRIACDGQLAVDPTPRGIGKTMLELYRALSVARPGWEFHLICRVAPEPGLFGDCPNVKLHAVEMPGDRLELWRRIRLPLALAAVRPDMVHAAAGLAAWPLTAPLLTTVYDLIPIDPVPIDAAAARWGRAVRSAVRRSRVVVTSSEHARGRIAELFRVSLERISVVPWAALSAPAELPDAVRRAELAARYGFPATARYVLHFGMNDPRKNTRHLLREWVAVPESARADVTLVIVGVQGPAFAEFQALAGAGVTVAGYVNEADARDLLGGAAAVAYPTLAEGFGLPLLDAFAAGVPVVASDRTSLPELAGGAAELIDPVTPGRLAAGLTRVLADAEYASELRQKGRVRAASFRWAATAEGFAQLFERAAKMPKPTSSPGP